MTASPSTDAERRLVRPLRAVESVTLTSERAADLGPHQFWLARRYVLSLECGHQQSRIRNAFDGPDPALLQPPLPKKVRCESCPSAPTRSRPAPPRNAPTFDPLAVGLFRAMVQADPSQEDDALHWVCTCRHLAEPREHAAVYGAVGLALFDRYLVDDDHRGTAEPVAALRRALVRWADDPSADTRAALSVARRRLYDHQHRVGLTWTSVRGILEAANAAASPPTLAVNGILRGITWDRVTREPLHSRAHLARWWLDAVAHSITDPTLERHGPGTHGAVADPGSVRAQRQAELRRADIELRQALSGLKNVPVGPQHVPVLASLIAAYGRAAPHMGEA